MKLGSIKSSIVSVAIVIIASKGLGFLREIIIANKFGTSADYDLYLIAIMLPALFYGVLNYASFYLLVPYFSKTENDSKSYWAIVNRIFLIGIVITFLTFALAPYLMKLWGAGMAVAQFEQIVFYCRAIVIIILFGTTEATMRAYLNSKHVVTYPTAGFIIFNITSIASILFLYEQFGVGAIAMGLVGGLFLQNLFLMVRLYFLENKVNYSFSLISETGSRIMFTAWILLAIELMNKGYFLIDRYFALQFEDGVISSLNYSQILIQLPEAVVGFAIGSVLFPHFSEMSINDMSRFASLYRKSIIASLLLSIPLAIFFFNSAFDIVSLVFMRGSFDLNSARLTSEILIPFAPSIVALFIITTTVRACHAGGWGKQVLWFTMFLFAVKIISTYFFVNQFGFVGLSAATAFSQVAMSLLLLRFISRKIFATGVDLGSFRITLLKIVLASVVTLVSVHYISVYASGMFETISWFGLLAKSTVSFVVVFLIFMFSSYLMGLSKEIGEVFSIKR